MRGVLLYLKLLKAKHCRDRKWTLTPNTKANKIILDTYDDYLKLSKVYPDLVSAGLKHKNFNHRI